MSEKAENTKQERRTAGQGANTYDNKTGLPLMVNLLIIRTMYYSKGDKAELFIEKHTEKKKRRLVSLFSSDLLGISRSRYGRIQEGYPFILSKREARRLSVLFSISTKYFERENLEMFNIEGVDIFSWKCYYRHAKKVPYEFDEDVNGEEKDKEEEIERQSELVKNKLKEIANKDWSKENNDDNPLFRIWYYFKTGKPYDKISPAVKCMKALQDLDMQEWKQLYEEEDIEEYRNLLKKHYEYVNALVTIKNIK